MKRALCTLAALGLLIPVIARADGTSVCGGAWTKTTTCQFEAAVGGRPILVHGTATNPKGGPAEVWVYFYSPYAHYQEAACHGTGMGTAKCDDDLYYKDLPVHVHAVAKWECRVEGSPGGTYRCEAY